MHVFVNGHRQVFGIGILHHDVVAAAAICEVGERHVIGPIGLVLFLGLEGDDAHRKIGDAVAHRGGLCEEAADGFEIENGFAASLFAFRGVELEMRRGEPDPLIRAERRQRGRQQA